MIRTFLIPLAATALLAGCVTSAPYGYRGGDRGDYYYGQPSVEYRHYGSPYGYDPHYGPYRSGFSIYGRYGSPYGYYGGPSYRHPYYGPYYGNPYYGHPYYGRPRVVHPRPGPGPGTDRTPDIGEGGGWRNIDEIRRRRSGEPTGGLVPAQQDATVPLRTRIERPRMEPRVGPSADEQRFEAPRARGGSGLGEMMRRTQEARDTGVRQQEE